MMVTFDPQNPNYKPYSAVIPEIKSGWLLQFRGKLAQSKWIQFFTAGIHSHSAMTLAFGGRVLCMEMLQFTGGQAVDLRDKVKRWPGIIDVFSPDLDAFPNYNGGQAASHMYELTRKGYGYKGIARLLAMRLPYIRRLVNYKADDAMESPVDPFCSHAVAAACQFGGGQDAVKCKANCLVTPQDLTQSLLWNYEFTLMP